MGENKQYISKKQDDGTVQISIEVISSIAAVAVNEIEGVDGLSAGIGVEIGELLGKKNLGKGIRVTVGEDDSVEVECNVIALYGFSVVTISQNIQEAVATAVESMTGLKVKAVNVNVCGINLPKTEPKK